MKRLALVALLASLAAAASAAPLSARIWAGCPVSIDSPVDNDVFAAGCDVRVNSRVDGKLRMAGGSVEIGPDAVIAGNAAIAGGEVVVKGTVKGDLNAAGGDVRIDGTVEGDVHAGAGDLTLGPNAKIGGKVSYRAGDFKRDENAQVANGVQGSRRGHRRASFDVDGFHGHSSMGWIWTASLMILAGVVAALLPGFSSRVSDELRTRPGLTLLFGFIAFVCIPAAAVLMMVTIIGIPIGVLAILGYAALLLVGYIATSVVLGGLVLDRVQAEAGRNVGWRALAAVIAMLAIGIVGRVPVLGHFVVFVALLVGVGAIVAAVIHWKNRGQTLDQAAA